jgi:hypothetical protein
MAYIPWNYRKTGQFDPNIILLAGHFYLWGLKICYPRGCKSSSLFAGKNSFLTGFVNAIELRNNRAKQPGDIMEYVPGKLQKCIFPGERAWPGFSK